MSPWRDAIVWWEIRRIPFNLVLLAAGLVSVFAILGVGSMLVAPGEDFVEPVLIDFGIVAYGLAANVFYALGWITELLWSDGDTARTAPLRRRVFWLGMTASVVLTLVPAFVMLVVWLVAMIA